MDVKKLPQLVGNRKFGGCKVRKLYFEETILSKNFVYE